MTEDISILQRDLRHAMIEVALLKQELDLARDEIRRARHARSALISMSEELRRPLNTIMGFTQLLKSSVRNDDGSVARIIAAGTEMLALIAQMIPAEIPGGEGGLELRRTPPPETPRDGAFKVVYVEDNFLNFTLIEEILAKRPQIKLIASTRGATAVAIVREHHAGLVLLDLHLPDMHGTEVLRCLREGRETKDVPVVVISADASASEIERLLAAGARDYLTKPFEIKRFLRTVDEVIAEQTSLAASDSLVAIEK